MTLHNPSLILAAQIASGSVGGKSRSPAKVAAVRANVAKAREVMRLKRLSQLCPGPIVDGVQSVTMAPVVDVRELLSANRYRKVDK